MRLQALGFRLRLELEAQALDYGFASWLRLWAQAYFQYLGFRHKLQASGSRLPAVKLEL